VVAGAPRAGILEPRLPPPLLSVLLPPIVSCLSLSVACRVRAVQHQTLSAITTSPRTSPLSGLPVPTAGRCQGPITPHLQCTRRPMRCPATLLRDKTATASSSIRAWRQRTRIQETLVPTTKPLVATQATPRKLERCRLKVRATAGPAKLVALIIPASALFAACCCCCCFACTLFSPLVCPFLHNSLSFARRL
jgi:hypothetical protein